MNKFKTWLAAARPRTLPLALASIGLGSFLAASDHQFNWNVLLFAGLTTIFLQVLSNLANDYGDSIHGADHDQRGGPMRAVQSGNISLKAMKIAISIVVILSLVSGLWLLKISIGFSGAIFAVFISVGILAILAAIRYTNGKKPYGYAGFGDVAVLLFFGLVGVLGTYYLHTGNFKWTYILPALSCGLLATAVLNVNNIRDIESDHHAGKKSIPVRLGRKNAVVYHWCLLGFAFLLALIFVLINYNSPIQFLFAISLPFLVKNGMAVTHKKNPAELDPYLRQMALSTLIFILTFGIGLIL